MFWRENKLFPLAHYLVPLALYISSRSLFFALFAIYAWETIETLIGRFVTASYREPWYDRLVGDPLQGGLAITTAWLADVAFCWRAEFTATFGWPERVFFFVAVFVAQVLLVGVRSRALGALLYGGAYVALLYAFFWSRSRTSTLLTEWIVATSIVVGVQALVVMPSLGGDGGPSYVRTRFSRSFMTSLLTVATLGFVGGALSTAIACRGVDC